MPKDSPVENVPKFTKRSGDRVIQGSNNALLVLGTDMPSDTDSGYGGQPGSGLIHAVVGREGEDLNCIADRAFFYLSQKNDPDVNLALSVGFDTRGVSAGVLKADSVRVIARQDLKIVVGESFVTIKDGVVTVDGAQVKLGKTAARHLVTEIFLQIYNNHAHDPNTGRNLLPADPSVLTQKTIAE